MFTLLRTGAAFLLALGCLGAIAQEAEQQQRIEIGSGVICDTVEKMQRYLVLYKQDVAPELAIKAVNSSADSNGACGMASVAFVIGKQVGTVDVAGGVMRITEITVLAFRTPAGWLKIPPTPQFTALFEKLEEA